MGSKPPQRKIKTSDEWTKGCVASTRPVFEKRAAANRELISIANIVLLEAIYSSFPTTHDVDCHDHWYKPFVSTNPVYALASPLAVNIKTVAVLCYNSMHLVRTGKPGTGQVRAEGQIRAYQAVNSDPISQALDAFENICHRIGARRDSSAYA